MINQLILCKRLFLQGQLYAEKEDAFFSGLAISVFQDAVELLIWTILKKNEIEVTSKSQFTTNLDAICKAGLVIPHKAKILELNTARVGFKHYGILPNPNDALKYSSYVRDFCQVICKTEFDFDFEKITMTDLIADIEIKEYLKAAEELFQSEKYSDSLFEGAKAKYLLLKRMSRFIPPVDSNLKRADSNFQYVHDYLTLLRENFLIEMLKSSYTDYIFLKDHLPTAMLFGDGSWKIFGVKEVCRNDCERLIFILINLTLQYEKMIKK